MDEQHIEAPTRIPSKFWQKMSHGILAILAFVMPFLFVPSAVFPFQLGKGLILAVAIVLATISFIISTIQNGSFLLPKNLFFLSILIIPIVFLISALATGATILNFFGYGFDVGSVGFITFGALFMFLVTEAWRTREEIFYAYLAFFVSAAIVFLFQIIRIIFGVNALSFGIFTSSVSNLIGNWNDLGIFAALTLIMSLVTIEMLTLSKLMKVFLYVLFVVSLLFCMFVNFGVIWMTLAVMSMVFFFYLFSFDRFMSTKAPSDMSLDGGVTERPSVRRKISRPAIAVFVISVVFIIAGQSLGTFISNKIHVVSLEVRPSWVATAAVDSDTIKSHPLFGSGPGTFGTDWVLYKPTGVNESLFWNTDFLYGIGLIPSFAATTGIVGLLAFVFFLLMFLWVGIKAIFYPLSDLFSRYLVTTSFLASAFLWVGVVFYVPSVVNLTLTFFFTGLFGAILSREGILKTVVLPLKGNPKISFVSILCLTIILLASLVIGYNAGKGILSQYYYAQSVVGFSKDQNIDTAEARMMKAIKLEGFDTYYRALSQIDLVRLNTLLGTQGADPDTLKTSFQNLLGDAIENARKATVINPHDYQNFVTLGDVYAALVPKPFAITGAFDNAKAMYETAEKVNPTAPGIPLSLAHLEVSNNDLEAARAYANQALALKQSYADAYFLLAQIDVTEGNVAKAIPSLESTIVLVPDNAGLYFQLGLLQYDQKDNNGAIASFSKAIQLENDYANAKYFLGLALYNVGRNSDAIIVFQNLAQTNPDSAEVKTILENLQANRAPFANVPPPNNKPESASKLPVPNTKAN